MSLIKNLLQSQKRKGEQPPTLAGSRKMCHSSCRNAQDINVNSNAYSEGNVTKPVRRPLMGVSCSKVAVLVIAGRRRVLQPHLDAPLDDMPSLRIIGWQFEGAQDRVATHHRRSTRRGLNRVSQRVISSILVRSLDP